MNNKETWSLFTLCALVVVSFVLLFKFKATDLKAESESTAKIVSHDHFQSVLLNEIGAPYKLGGKDPEGYDCSGFVYHHFNRQYQIKLPRSSHEMPMACAMIEPTEIKKFDLLFFDTNGGMDRINHVGIYLDSGEFIHSSTKRGVIISKVDEGFYQARLMKIGRIKQLQ